MKRHRGLSAYERASSDGETLTSEYRTDGYREKKTRGARRAKNAKIGCGPKVIAGEEGNVLSQYILDA